LADKWESDKDHLLGLFEYRRVLALLDSVEVRGPASEDICSGAMLVPIRWQRCNMAAPLSQLTVINAGESTRETIKHWHYWVAQE
jgi:hypothetical protein